MRIRKLFVIMLVLLMVLQSGCRQEGENAETYPELYDGIEYDDTCARILITLPDGSFVMEYQEEPYEEEEENKTIDYYYGDAEFQEAVKEHAQIQALDTDSATLAHAWNIQPVLKEFGYIPDDYFPTQAIHYSNGVVEIIYHGDSYIEFRENIEKYRFERIDSQMNVYVSAEDGHVIFISGWYISR